MPKIIGLFDYFPELHSLPVEKIVDWFLAKKYSGPKLLQNQIYNRILYPQTIPVTPSELMFDLTVLRESIKSQPKKYYDSNFRRIYIPEKFLTRFTNLQKLVMIFMDAFTQPGLTYILLKSENLGTKNLGTVVKPHLLSRGGWVYVWILGKKYQVKIGDLMIIPTNSSRVDIRFSSEVAKLLSQSDLTCEIIGGQFGIAIDTRI